VKSRKQIPWLLILSGILIGSLGGIGLLIEFGVVDSGSLFPGLTHQSLAQVGLPGIGKPAQDFTLQDLSGNPVRLSELKGHVVVLNFWATWCGPCAVEMPGFQQIYEKYSPDLVILGVNLEESPDEVSKFVESMHITYPILLDPGGGVNRSYQIIDLPNTFFIDKQGIIRYRHIGLLSEDQFEEYLANIGVVE
jgi:peroxiredoxin